MPLPVGAIHLSTSSTNPAASTQLGYGVWARLAQGRTLLGVEEGVFEAASVGGALIVTPAGSVANHAHELPFQKVTGGLGTFRALASSVFGTGTSRAAESSLVPSVSDSTSAAVSLSQAVAPAFVGTPHSTLPPYLAVYVWVRTA